MFEDPFANLVKLAFKSSTKTSDGIAAYNKKDISSPITATGQHNNPAATVTVTPNYIISCNIADDNVMINNSNTTSPA